MGLFKYQYYYILKKKIITQYIFSLFKWIGETVFIWYKHELQTLIL